MLENYNLIPKNLFIRKIKKDTLKILSSFFSCFSLDSNHVKLYDSNDKTYILSLITDKTTPTTFKLTLSLEDGNENNPIYTMYFKNTSEYAVNVTNTNSTLTILKEPYNFIKDNILHNTTKSTIKQICTDYTITVSYIDNYVSISFSQIDDDSQNNETVSLKIAGYIQNNALYTGLNHHKITISNKDGYIEGYFFIEPETKNFLIVDVFATSDYSNNILLANNISLEDKEAIKAYLYSYLSEYTDGIIELLFTNITSNYFEKFCNPHNLPFKIYS